MRANTSLLAVGIALGLTYLALIGHSYLPEKRLVILPSASDEWEIYPYSDSEEGGPSQSEYSKLGDSYLWTCHVAEAGTFNYCGLSVWLPEEVTDGVDFTPYHSLRLKLERIDHKHDLRLILRHQDMRIYDPEDANAAQLNTFSVRHRDMDLEDNEIFVGFNEFSVAEWWKTNRDLPRDLMQPAFGNILVVGLDFGAFLEPGTYQVRVDGIEAVGDWVSEKTWYQAILLGWLLGLSVWVTQRVFTLRRLALRNRRRLDRLANQNQELKEESTKYREMSTKDSLTGALNRFGFERAMARVMHHPNNQPISLILLDIDHFKAFNDTYGHEAGDKVLQELVGVLDRQTRTEDILCRWGGEEFLLLCPKTNVGSALQLAEKIREVIATVELKLNVEVKLTASFGVAEIRFGESYSSAFARADKALYSAKAQGRDRVILAEQ